MAIQRFMYVAPWLTYDQYGQPARTLDMGVTFFDEQDFNGYLEEMKKRSEKVRVCVLLPSCLIVLTSHPLRRY
jgi:hypothetical protein